MVVQDIFGRKEESAVVALSPVAFAGDQPLRVTVVGVRIEGRQGAEQGWTKLEIINNVKNMLFRIIKYTTLKKFKNDLAYRTLHLF